MLLTLKDGRVFQIHFHHAKDEQELWNWTTTAIIHAGLCVEKARPCNTPGCVTGVAHSSRKDNFDKADGRKVALGRALISLEKQDKATRGEIWEQYKKVHPPKPRQR